MSVNTSQRSVLATVVLTSALLATAAIMNKNPLNKCEGRKDVCAGQDSDSGVLLQSRTVYEPTEDTGDSMVEESEDKDAEGAAEDAAAAAEEAGDLAAPACKWHVQATHDGVRCEGFVQGVFFFLNGNSSDGIQPKLSGVQASPLEDDAKNFVEHHIEPWILDMNGYEMSAVGTEDGSWRTVFTPESLPKITARVELLQHMYAARHAWVALSALDGDEAARQRQHLKHLYSGTQVKHLKRQHLSGDLESSIHPFALSDEEAIVQKRLELAQDLRNVLISPALLQLLEVAKSCFLPHDHHLFGHNSQLSQRSRVRPVGPLTKDSFILLGEPDGSITEKDDLRMPMMTLGTGFGDCYQGKMVHYPEADDSYATLTENSCAPPFYPEVGFYRNAVNSGLKGIDTAFIYGTEEQIGREVPEAKLNAPDVFITTKSMTPAFRKMLGVLHGTDKMADQLRALQRRSVNVLYNHEDANSYDEWRHLEEEIRRGHARALGASGLLDSLGHAMCVRYGNCSMHISAFQENISPCQPQTLKYIKNMLRHQEMLGNITMVGHSAITFCDGEPIIEGIAKRLGRSVPVLALRANLEQGIPMLAQTKEPEHLKQDLSVFDFELSPGDLSQILLNERLYMVSEEDDLFEE